MLCRLFLGLLVLVATGTEAQDVEPCGRIVCYTTNWSQFRTGNSSFFPENINPTLCTHIIYAFARIQDNHLAANVWNDEDLEAGVGLFTRLNNMKQAYPEVKTLLAVGGWAVETLNFTSLVQSPDSRLAFATNSTTFLRKRNFDGLDIAWEYPAHRGSPAGDRELFTVFIKELRHEYEKEALRTGKPRLLLTAAVAAQKNIIDRAYDIPAISKELDFISVKSYDMRGSRGSWENKTGHHSPLYSATEDSGYSATLNMDFAAKYWVQKGAPKEKLNIGLALYGRSFTLASPSNYWVGAAAIGFGAQGIYTLESGFLSYYEICDMKVAGGQAVDIVNQRVPFIHLNDQWVGFDSAESLREKVRYVKKNKYGGVMVWSLPLDDFTGTHCPGRGQYPLMHTIANECFNRGYLNTQAPAQSTLYPPSTITPPLEKTTSRPMDPLYCKHRKDGYYHSARSCSEYFICMAGVISTMECAPSLVFNKINITCDLPNNNLCPSATTTSSRTAAARTMTQESPGNLNNRNTIAATRVNLTKISNPKQDTARPMDPLYCKHRKDDYYHSARSCSEYIICMAGAAYTMECAPGLVFNKINITCDSPDKYVCSLSPSDTTDLSPTTTGLPIETTTYNKGLDRCGRIVCYTTNWSQYRSGSGKFNPENIDPSLCTHIIYAYARIKGNHLATGEVHDDDTIWQKGLYTRLNNLKQRYPKVKTLLAVGGWNMGSYDFSRIVKSPSYRRDFITHSTTFLRHRRFDGLELSWEYPTIKGGSPKDREHFTVFIRELRQEYENEAQKTGKPRLLLTAVGASEKSTIDTAYDIPAISQDLDFINLMSYDLHASWRRKTGHNSPLYAASDEIDDRTLNLDFVAKYWVQKGAPKEKLNIGLALYGRSFTLASPSNYGVGAAALGLGTPGFYTKESGLLSYYEVCDRKKAGVQELLSKEQRVPYFHHNNQWVGFDNAESLREKVRYVKGNSFGGVMVWALPLDDFMGTHCGQGKYPLLRAIADECQYISILHTLVAANTTLHPLSITTLLPSNTTLSPSNTTPPIG